MVRLVTEDAPAVVALQEVPVWALPRLESWSGMKAVGAVARRARLGPLARPLTELDPDLFRSAFDGQANALLVDRRLGSVESEPTVVLNPPWFRREEARRLRLSPAVRTWWARERRVCQRIHVDEDGRRFLVANLHASAHPDRRVPSAELERAGRFLEPASACILCGDFNVPAFAPPGFSRPIRGIDQIVVRGLSFERPPARWPNERRRFRDRLLSDHAPIEAVVA